MGSKCGAVESEDLRKVWEFTIGFFFHFYELLFVVACLWLFLNFCLNKINK